MGDIYRKSRLSDTAIVQPLSPRSPTIQDNRSRQQQQQSQQVDCLLQFQVFKKGVLQTCLYTAKRFGRYQNLSVCISPHHAHRLFSQQSPNKV
jgi:hypothetical protein